MTAPERDRLRDLFALWRAGSAGVVPPFAQVWAAAEARIAHTPRPRMSPRLVGGVLLATAAAVALLVARMTRQPQALTLSAWRSPTEFLLQPSADAMLGSVPRLSASAIEVHLIGRGRATP